ncbi:hypothetical protein Tco_1352273 [Tanacetum coccineum]
MSKSTSKKAMRKGRGLCDRHAARRSLTLGLNSSSKQPADLADHSDSKVLAGPFEWADPVDQSDGPDPSYSGLWAGNDPWPADSKSRPGLWAYDEPGLSALSLTTIKNLSEFFQNFLAPFKYCFVFKQFNSLEFSSCIVDTQRSVLDSSKHGQLGFSSNALEHVKFDWISDITDVPIPLESKLLSGWIIREMREFWRDALLVSLVSMKDYGDETIKHEIEVFKKVEELGLDEAWKVKSLVKENDMMRILRGGPNAAKWKRKQRQWHIAYPSGNLQECSDWMIEQIQ